jgi:DNA helicase-2/ATP-dependent DNA helicase PcrA
MDIQPERVSGAFYYVRLGKTVGYAAGELLDRAGLERVLGLEPSSLS